MRMAILNREHRKALQARGNISRACLIRRCSECIRNGWAGYGGAVYHCVLIYRPVTSSQQSGFEAAKRYALEREHRQIAPFTDQIRLTCVISFITEIMDSRDRTLFLSIANPAFVLFI